MTKLNTKQEQRTLHAHRNTENEAEPGFILIERARYKEFLSGKNKWSDSRVFISDEEIEKLHNQMMNIRSHE